jgi:hypothetical protein
MEVRKAIEVTEASTCTKYFLLPYAKFTVPTHYKILSGTTTKQLLYTPFLGWLVNVVLVDGKLKVLGRPSFSRDESIKHRECVGTGLFWLLRPATVQN